MATKTEHYSLSLPTVWDGLAAAQIRADYSALDGAIHAAQLRSEGAVTKVVDLEYNVYNLILQDYYDGKQTGYKKALVFDGFRDGSMIASSSQSLVRLDNKLTLSGKRQGDVSSGFASSAYPATNGLVAGPYISAGYGTLTGLTVRTIHGSGGHEVASFDFKVTLNNKVVQSGRMSLCFYEQMDERKMQITPVPLKPGDQFHIEVQDSNTNHHFYGPTSTGTLGGIYNITPQGGESGTAVTPALELPDRKLLRAWVRYKNGSVSLSARSGGKEYPFTAGEARQTVNLQGGSCTEQEFILDAPPESGTLSFALTVSLDGAEGMEVFDYGVVLV